MSAPVIRPPRFKDPKEADAWLANNQTALELLSCKGPVWLAENGDRILYSTERLSTGRFGVAIWRQSGQAGDWTEWIYAREFAKRKDAKAKAMKLYEERSPKWRARRGR